MKQGYTFKFWVAKGFIERPIIQLEDDIEEESDDDEYECYYDKDGLKNSFKMEGLPDWNTTDFEEKKEGWRKLI